MDFVGTIWAVVSTILSWLWAVLSFLFSIWLIGPLLQLLFIAGVAWIFYRYTPGPVRRFTGRRVMPYLGVALTPVQWYLTKLVAKPEWLRQPGDPSLQYVERIVKVRVRERRSFRSWLFGGLRWSAATAAIIFLAQNWETIAPTMAPYVPF